MEKDKILVAGSLNMDLVIKTEKLPEIGETVLGTSFITVPGGKGGNQAVAAAKLRSNVTMVGAVGSDEFGRALIENLKNNMVDVRGIIIKDGPSGVASICVDQQGRNMIMVAPGANMEFTGEELPAHLFSGVKILLLQLEIPLKTVQFCIERAKEQNIQVILNPAPAQKLERELLQKVDILVPNETELKILTGYGTKSLEEVKRGAEMLLDMGVNAVIVTLGEKGCLIKQKDFEKYLPAYEVKAIDTTAAGDAFIGGLATALLQDYELEEAVDFASAVAAVSVTKMGAQTSLPERDEVEKFIVEWKKS
jgi:ribokinase